MSQVADQNKQARISIVSDRYQVLLQTQVGLSHCEQDLYAST